MRRGVSIVIFALAVAVAATGRGVRTFAEGKNRQAPSAAEIAEMVERLRVNQHRNDDALALYERHERRYSWKHDGQRTIRDDKTFRVVPTGTGVLKLILAEKGKQVSDDYYRKQLCELEKALNDALNPQLSRQKRAIEKWTNRTRERRELVDAVPGAFLFTWLGRETQNGRSYAKLQLEPNPDFDPPSRNAEMFRHVRAVIWVDEAEGQLARAEAEIIRDIGVFGGIFGKLYKGGTFVMQQVRVAEGVWLPTRIEFDFDGRRFFFPFSVNEVTEAAAYRRIGPPQEALAAVRREIQNGTGVPRPAPAGTSSNARK